jgi:hypothetical protein
MILVVVVVAARVVLALAASGVVLGFCLVLFVDPLCDHVLELGDGTRATSSMMGSIDNGLRLGQ